MKKNILRAVSDVIIDDDFAWIISDAFNGLLKYSVLKDELELVCMYPDLIGTKRAAFSKIIKVQDEIFFIPLTATDIFYYRITEGRFYKLNIPSNYFYANKNIHAIEYNNFIYCINRFSDFVMKIEPITKEISFFIAPVIEGREEEIEREIYRLYKAPCLYENKIIWSNYDEFLTVFDLQSETFSSIPVKGLIYGDTRLSMSEKFSSKKLRDWIIGVSVYKNMLWLFTFEGKVYQYHQEKIDEVESSEFGERNAELYDNEKNAVLPYFCGLVSVNDELWFIPQYRSHCIKYNGNRNRYELALQESAQIWSENQREYSLCKVIDKKILLFSYCENCFYIFDTEEKCVYRKQVELDLEKFVRSNLECRRLMMLNTFYGMDDLPSLFWLIDNGKEKASSENSSIGEDIYQSMKKIML